jgi:POT family proton-dependent oligopeptide transporter
MASGNAIEADVLAKGEVPHAADEKTTQGHFDIGVVHDPMIHTVLDEEYEGKPSEEDLHTLRRVSGKINWAAYTIAFCELAERFSYYGSSVLYTNFVRSPLPEGSTTGAGWGRNPKNQSGALGWGQKSSQGISLFNQFFAYLVPLLGAWVADARLGRYKTIHIAIVISTVAHIILVAAASPGVIVHPDSSAAAFLIGLICLCFGTGFFKANIAPLLAEQNLDTRMRVETLKSGERVLVDPAITNTRIFLYFYLPSTSVRW